MTAADSFQNIPANSTIQFDMVSYYSWLEVFGLFMIAVGDQVLRAALANPV
jgi:hypothetical protein